MSFMSSGHHVKPYRRTRTRLPTAMQFGEFGTSIASFWSPKWGMLTRPCSCTSTCCPTASSTAFAGGDHFSWISFSSAVGSLMSSFAPVSTIQAAAEMPDR